MYNKLTMLAFWSSLGARKSTFAPLHHVALKFGNSNETDPVEAQKKAGVDAIISDNLLRVKPKLLTT